MTYPPDEKLQPASKRPRGPRQGHHVYLIADGLRHVKIGHSSSATARLSELQVGSPHALALAHSWRLEREAAKVLERQLHQALSWASARGEWFAIDWRSAAQIGDAFFRGDGEAAVTIADLLRQEAENEVEDHRCRRAWYDVRPKDRRAVEAAAKARRAELGVANARITLALLDLGFHPPHLGKHHLQIHWMRERCQGLIRSAEGIP